MLLGLKLAGLCIGAAAVLVAMVLWNAGGSLTGPPGTPARIKRYLTTNSAHAAPMTDWPELRTPIYPLSATEMTALAASSARALGWQAVKLDSNAQSMTAVVVSRWFHFKDDVQVQFEPAETAGAAQGAHSTLSASSRSRVGRADFGANAGHVIKLLLSLKTRVANNSTPAAQ